MQQLNCTQHTQLSCQVAAQFVGHVHEIDPVPDISSEHIILWGVNTSLLPRHDISFPYATRKYDEIYCAWFFWNYQEPFISHHKSMVSSLELFTSRWVHHWFFPHTTQRSLDRWLCAQATRCQSKPSSPSLVLDSPQRRHVGVSSSSNPYGARSIFNATEGMTWHGYGNTWNASWSGCHTSPWWSLDCSIWWGRKILVGWHSITAKLLRTNTYWE